jgi:hypothetical protein
MGDGVLRFAHVWSYAFIDVLDLFSIATTTPIRAAVIDMHMSSHRRADKIAQYRRSVIIKGVRVPVQIKNCPVWPVHSPTGLCHGSVAGFMFLLRVSLKY